MLTIPIRSIARHSVIENTATLSTAPAEADVARIESRALSLRARPPRGFASAAEPTRTFSPADRRCAARHVGHGRPSAAREPGHF